MGNSQAKLLVVVGTIGLLVAMAAYMLAVNIENRNIRSEVKVHATNLAAQLEVALDRKFEVLYGLQALFNASVHVDADEFALAADGFLSRDLTLEGVEWVPKVPHAEREKYERDASKRIPHFFIKDSMGDGDYIPSPQADFYYPIYYLEPKTIYRSARGLNLESYGPTWEALQLARDTAEISVSDVLSEIPDSKPFSLIFTALPVFKSIPLTVSQRREDLEGYVVGLFRSEQVINTVLAESRIDDMALVIESRSPIGGREIVYRSDLQGDSLKPIGRKPRVENALNKTPFSQSVVIPLKNQQWVLTVTPNAEGEAALRGNMPIWVFLLVLVFTTVGSITIGVLIRQRELVSHAVVERTEQLNSANERLEKLSNTDFLTGLANRRRFDMLADKAWRRAISSGSRLGVLMIDVDHFKFYNDHFGHITGDACLKQVASILRDEIGEKTEIIARYGGEEFIALLEGDEATTNNAARLLFAVREKRIAHAPEAAKEFLTVSVGAAWLEQTEGHSLHRLISAADDCLYRAKEQGRDRLIEVTLGERA